MYILPSASCLPNQFVINLVKPTHTHACQRVATGNRIPQNSLDNTIKHGKEKRLPNRPFVAPCQR